MSHQLQEPERGQGEIKETKKRVRTEKALNLYGLKDV